MEHSAELVEAVAHATKMLESNTSGELVLSARKRIWVALGPRKTKGARPEAEVGQRRRAMLAILASRRVLPLWQQAFPANQEPQNILQIAEKHLDGKIDFQTGWSINNLFWASLDEMTSIAVAAGYAASQALTTALSDERFDPENLAPEVSERDLDPYEWDASFYASVAYAGSAPWESESDASRRRQFWDWFLREAVPRSWDFAS